MSKIRVLVVDDSVTCRRMIADSLSTEPDIEVVGTAANGKIGLEKIGQLSPDLVTLDMEMPVLDGLQTLKLIRKTYHKLPVIMCSVHTVRGAMATLDALALGANDYVAKPLETTGSSGAVEAVRTDLAPRIRALCQREVVPIETSPTRVIAPVDSTPAPSACGRIDLVAIGVSTGGPNALAALLPRLTVNFPVPVVVVQHMPPLFTRMLAERISGVSRFRAGEATAGSILKPGELWIAPGGLHMEVERVADGVQLRLHDGPAENSCRPSVDVLFRSVARVFGAHALGVVLTGMGSDGLRGCERIREAGGRVFVQDEASSVVWGMPGAVAQAGLAEKILPLGELALEINRCVEAGMPRRSAACGAPAVAS